MYTRTQAASSADKIRAKARCYTFAIDMLNTDLLREELFRQLAELVDKFDERRWQAYTLTVKVKYADFEQTTRSWTHRQPLDIGAAQESICELLARTEAGTRPARLIGVTLSGLTAKEAPVQSTWL